MFRGVFFLIALQEKKLYKLCRRHGRNSKRPHEPPLNHTLIPMEPSGANSFHPARSTGPSISDTYTSLEHIVLCLLFMVLVFKTRPKHRLPSPVSLKWNHSTTQPLCALPVTNAGKPVPLSSHFLCSKVLGLSLPLGLHGHAAGGRATSSLPQDSQ